MTDFKFEIPMTVAQLAILVLDGSGSMMRENKSKNVHEATKEFIQRLQKSRVAQSFWVSILAFDTDVSYQWSNPPYRRVSEIDVSTIENPVKLAGGSWTNIAKALEDAGKVAETFINDDDIPVDPKNKKIVIFLLTDGGHNQPGDPESVAKNLLKDYEICTIAYGEKANEELLKKLVKDPSKNFLKTDDPEVLRDFFIHSSMLIE